MPLSKDYSMGSEMIADIEKVVGNHLALVGPMLDGYLKEIGSAMHSKLMSSHLPGLAPSIGIYLPWQIMRFVAAVPTSYGGDIKPIAPRKSRGNDKGKLIIFLEKEETATTKKLNPPRFNGMNYFKNC